MEEQYFDPKYVKTLTGQDFEGATLKQKDLVVVFFLRYLLWLLLKIKTRF